MHVFFMAAQTLKEPVVRAFILISLTLHCYFCTLLPFLLPLESELSTTHKHFWHLYIFWQLPMAMSQTKVQQNK